LKNLNLRCLRPGLRRRPGTESLVTRKRVPCRTEAAKLSRTPAPHDNKSVEPPAPGRRTADLHPCSHFRRIVTEKILTCQGPARLEPRAGPPGPEAAAALLSARRTYRNILPIQVFFFNLKSVGRFGKPGGPGAATGTGPLLTCKPGPARPGAQADSPGLGSGLPRPTRIQSRWSP
jgi:hypothetical protein